MNFSKHSVLYILLLTGQALIASQELSKKPTESHSAEIKHSIEQEIEIETFLVSQTPEKDKFLHAVSTNDLITVKKYLDTNKALANTTTKGGSPAICIAAESGLTTMIKLLAAYDADLDALDSEGQSALFLAAKNDELELVKALLISGAQWQRNKYNVSLPYLLEGHENRPLMRLLTALPDKSSCLKNAVERLFSDTDRDYYLVVFCKNAHGAEIFDAIKGSDLKYLQSILKKPLNSQDLHVYDSKSVDTLFNTPLDTALNKLKNIYAKDEYDTQKQDKTTCTEVISQITEINPFLWFMKNKNNQAPINDIDQYSNVTRINLLSKLPHFQVLKEFFCDDIILTVLPYTSYDLKTLDQEMEQFDEEQTLVREVKERDEQIKNQQYNPKERFCTYGKRSKS